MQETPASFGAGNSASASPLEYFFSKSQKNGAMMKNFL